jgi:hypothetical protein
LNVSMALISARLPELTKSSITKVCGFHELIMTDH